MPPLPIAGPISPKLVKKVEQEILSEAKNEEKHLKYAIKDLAQVEKSESKAQKTIFKVDSALDKAAKREQNTLRDMHKAEHSHAVALSAVEETQKDLEASKQAHAKAKEALRQKSIYVEEAMQAHDEHTKIRNEKLSILRGTNDQKAIAEVVASETLPQPQVAK